LVLYQSLFFYALKQGLAFKIIGKIDDI